MRKILIIAAIVIVAGVIVWRVSTGGASEEDGRYEFAEITRGNLENIVSSTGTLSAVGTVEVGTQVSGTIAQVLVDYNEDVEEGQILAILDTKFLAASVRDAEAALMRAEAQYEQALSDHERMTELHASKLVSDDEFDDSATSLKVAEASVVSADASLERARTNMSYAVIRSPIDGTVIMRDVDEGQTVAASLSTPRLFVIAEDLSEMEIHALVDESDIGQIKVGQSVRFTVEAYLDDVFEGTVRQIWLQPETISNVVNYTVVVDASNDKGLLLPGMTATVDFLVDERTDVLLVANAALRFQPTEDMLSEFREAMRERMQERMKSEGGETRAPAQGAPGGAHAQGAGGPFGQKSGNDAILAFAFRGDVPDNAAVLWHLDDEGNPAAAPIVKGVTDGRSTEIASGRDIEEGMQVIKTVVAITEEEQESRNPLSNTFRRRR
jgi:HlyD family secretion protein